MKMIFLIQKNVFYLKKYITQKQNNKNRTMGNLSDIETPVKKLTIWTIPPMPPNWEMSIVAEIPEIPSIWEMPSTTTTKISYLLKIPSYIMRIPLVPRHKNLDTISEETRLKRHKELGEIHGNPYRIISKYSRLKRMNEVYKILNNLLTAENPPSKDSPIPNFTYGSGNVNIIIYNFIYALSRCFTIDRQKLNDSLFFQTSASKEATNMFNQLNLSLQGWYRRIYDLKKYK